MMLSGSVLCIGSEWHRYPSSFFVPAYIEQVKWIDDGFNGLLPLPFNETLGGTKAAPHYFNNKNKASKEQFVNLSCIPYQVSMLLDFRKWHFLVLLNSIIGDNMCLCWVLENLRHICTMEVNYGKVMFTLGLSMLILSCCQFVYQYCTSLIGLPKIANS